MSIIARTDIKKVKKVFHISSNYSAEPAQQVLAIRVGERHCCFAITDISGKKLYQLAYYSDDAMDDGIFMNLFGNHPELNDPFYKVLVGYDHPQSILVPFQQYRSEEVPLLMKTIYASNNQSEIISESLPEWQLYNVYAIPKELNNRMIRKFPAGRYWHAYTICIRNIVTADSTGKLWIDFRQDDFILIVAKESKLLLAQTFSYSTPDDVIYYLLKICQQFLFSQKEVKLIVSGFIEKESALYKELYRYFLNFEFRSAEWDVGDGNDYTAHFFTSLNDLVLCAS